LLLLLLIGVFLFSDQPILTAAALDVVGRLVTTTAIGSASVVFYYMATIFAISACVLWFIPLRPPSHVT
jgi:hypothetical protein